MNSPSDHIHDPLPKAPETVTLPVWLYDRMARAYYNPLRTSIPADDQAPGTRGEPDVDAGGEVGVFDMSQFEGIGDVPPGWRPIGVQASKARSARKAEPDGSSQG